MWSFPASFMAEFFDNHGMYSLRDRPRWRTVAGGSRSYVEAISAPWRDRVRLRAPVRRIERLPDGVRIEAEGCESEEFDEVVIATHSDQALAMLADPSEAEREILGAIPYQRNEAVLHTDTSLLPRRRAAWSSWNFHLAAEPAARQHRHLLDEQPAAPARRARVPGHAQPRRGDRPGEGPAPLRVRPPRLHRRRASPPRPATPRSAACAAPTTAAPTGAGASTRTGWSARCGPASGSALASRDSEIRGAIDPQSSESHSLARAEPDRGGAGRVSASAVYEGTVRHRRFEPVEHAFRYRLFLMYLDLDELPGVLDPYPLWSARRRGARPLPPRGLHGRPGAAAGRVRPRRGRGRDRRAARGPGAPARRPALPRPLLQPGQLLLLL